MRVPFLLPLIVAALLGPGAGQAQQMPAAPDSARRPTVESIAKPSLRTDTPVAPRQGTMPVPGTDPRLSAGRVLVTTTSPVPTDVIVLTNGDELSAQVVRITPQVVRYLAPFVADSLQAVAATTPTDTFQLATADIFMIRYANGTKEVLRPAPAEPGTSLAGLNVAQRYELGRRDSRQYYQPAKGVFWGTFAGALATTSYGGLGGVAVGAATALTPPPRHSLSAPNLTLLDDPAYYDGYRKQAQNRKLGKAAAGYGVGLGTGLALTLVAVLILISSWR